MRIVTDSSGITEEVTESLPGKAQTLDGKAEDKGKGISRVEESDTPELFIEEDKHPYGKKLIIITEPAESALGRILDQTLMPNEYDIERIMMFHQVFYAAYNDLDDYITSHTEVEEEELDILEAEDCVILWFAEKIKDELYEVMSHVEGEDQCVRTQSTPTVILRRIEEGLSSLRDIWQKLVLEDCNSQHLFGDNDTPVRKVKEISIVQSFMKKIELLEDGDNKGTNEEEMPLPQCADLYLDCNLVAKLDPPKEEVKGPPIGRNESEWIGKRWTGCACGMWCAGPSRSQ
ncbi:hypothetical protein NHQ30_009340 [Ciborinia camelliae]|nr:hypothetical protein NHQ30_009340 [Ciborinia camelliae]